MNFSNLSNGFMKTSLARTNNILKYVSCHFAELHGLVTFRYKNGILKRYVVKQIHNEVWYKSKKNVIFKIQLLQQRTCSINFCPVLHNVMAIGLSLISWCCEFRSMWSGCKTYFNACLVGLLLLSLLALKSYRVKHTWNTFCYIWVAKHLHLTKWQYVLC